MSLALSSVGPSTEVPWDSHLLALWLEQTGHFDDGHSLATIVCDILSWTLWLFLGIFSPPSYLLPRFDSTQGARNCQLLFVQLVLMIWRDGCWVYCPALHSIMKEWTIKFRAFIVQTRHPGHHTTTQTRLMSLSAEYKVVKMPILKKTTHVFVKRNPHLAAF